MTNYINTARAATINAKGRKEVTNDTDIENNTDENELQLTSESEIGPEVTHIYQIENKVLSFLAYLLNCTITNIDMLHHSYDYYSMFYSPGSQ